MALSNMMTHYLAVKEKYKDCVVFYRLGDFYEMFFDDAIKVSGLLELTLTGRDCGLEERAPMCGVPYHAADVYIAKLVSLGEKVAICEQLSEPNGKELVRRDVVKVVTAGTFNNSEFMDEKSNNFLVAIYLDDGKAAVSWADVTTGEFSVRSYDEKDDRKANNYDGKTFENAVVPEILNTLARINPSEIVCNKSAYETFTSSAAVTPGELPPFQQIISSDFEFINAENVLKKQFNVASLNQYGLNEEETCVAGALITYINDTQKQILCNINEIKRETPENFMMLDASAIRNLELVKTLHQGKKFGSLLWLLDKTKTAMGARKMQSWILAPLGRKDEINERLDGVESLFNSTLIRESLSDILSSVKDLGRLSGKIANGNIMPKDCVSLKKSLEVLPNVKFQLSGIDTPFVKNIKSAIADFSETVTLLESAINPDAPATLKDGGFIREGFDAELDEERSLSKNAPKELAKMEEDEKAKTGIKTLKIRYNRVFGYYIEVSNSFKDQVPYNYIRRQTLVGGERFVTEELKTLESKILNSSERSLAMENKIYDGIKSHLFARLNEIQAAAEAVANLDVIVALATVAKKCGYCKPEMCEAGSPLEIIAGRHPVVEAVSKQKFVTNDCYMNNGSDRTLIITGPNMAGKSTFMRQVALITLLAHIGSFVPAKTAKIPLTDKIFTRIGASDSLISDQSTFMVEMSETATILMKATENSLIILDEIGRGTSTYDGLSIAWAVVDYITRELKAKTLFATHYHELTELEGVIEGVKNYKVTVKEFQGTIIFLRKIMRGGANRSFGIEVASLAGVPKFVTEKAKSILKTLEKSDINRSGDYGGAEGQTEDRFSAKDKEALSIIKELDLNNISPMQALSLLADLQEKVKE